jgi:hypothetical protein
MQVRWTVMVSLGLALGEVLRLAVTPVTAWAGRRDVSPSRPRLP